MTESNLNSSVSNEDKQKVFFEKARKGVLKFLNDKGGQLPMGELHDYSLNKYLIQHQSFSRMMETFVDEALVDFDSVTYTVTITDTGKSFANS